MKWLIKHSLCKPVPAEENCTTALVTFRPTWHCQSLCDLVLYSCPFTHPSRSHSCEWPVSWSWLFLGRYINSISSLQGLNAWVESRGGSSQDFQISCCLKDKVLPYWFVIQEPFASDASLCFQTRLFFLPSWSPSRQPKWSLLGPVDMLHYLFYQLY